MLVYYIEDPRQIYTFHPAQNSTLNGPTSSTHYKIHRNRWKEAWGNLALTGTGKHFLNRTLIARALRTIINK